jgi:exodeoxyribonuclease VII small subunit
MTKATRTYKEAMGRLDQILENIDQSDISIDELADQVVEAAELLKRCKKILTDTEAKVKNVLEDLETEFGETQEDKEES